MGQAIGGGRGGLRGGEGLLAVGEAETGVVEIREKVVAEEGDVDEGLEYRVHEAGVAEVEDATEAEEGPGQGAGDGVPVELLLLLLVGPPLLVGHALVVGGVEELRLEALPLPELQLEALGDLRVVHVVPALEAEDLEVLHVQRQLVVRRLEVLQDVPPAEAPDVHAREAHVQTAPPEHRAALEAARQRHRHHRQRRVQHVLGDAPQRLHP